MTTTYPFPDDTTVMPTGGGQTQIGSVSGEYVAIGDNARVVINYYTDVVDYDAFENLPPRPGAPPYKGLAAYTDTPADVANFFGREAVGRALAVHVVDSRFVALIGASGSGKSSLLRAGLASQLRQDNWLIHIITPQAAPLTELAASLTCDDPALSAALDLRRALAEDPAALSLAAGKLVHRAKAAGLLLVVDQFEQLFTRCHDPQERQQFIAVLLAAGQSSVAIALGLRAGDLGRLAAYPALNERVIANRHDLGPIPQADLVRVIAEPARNGQWKLVKELMELMLSDIAEEPGGLPLLSRALRETWERRSENVLTLRGYREAGGVERAIVALAEETFARLPVERQDLVRRVFLLLTEPGEKGSPDTRRTASRAEMDALGEPGVVADVLDALADARLITVDSDTVQVAHEALIRDWPALCECIDGSREQLHFRRELARAADQWEGHRHNRAYLWRSSALAIADQRLSASRLPLSGGMKRFLDASRWAEDRRWVDSLLAMAAGVFGLGLPNYLLLTRWLGLGPTFNVPLLMAPSLVIGAIAGLLYGPFFDGTLTRVGLQPGRRRLAAGMLGAGIYGLVFFTLNLAAPGANYLLILALGGLWGIVAGLGRESAPTRLLWPLGVGLACGLVLTAGYLVVTLLGGGAALGDYNGPPPLLLIFMAGVLLPMLVLLVEWLSHYLGERKLKGV